MSASENNFSGTWLHQGSQRGQNFSYHESEYDHAEEGGSGSTPMRHAEIDQEGQKVGVWVPKGWTDEQTREALESNW